MKSIHPEKKVNVAVTAKIAPSIIEKIDEAAKLDGRSRSGFLMQAAHEKAKKILAKAEAQP